MRFSFRSLWTIPYAHAGKKERVVLLALRIWLILALITNFLLALGLLGYMAAVNTGLAKWQVRLPLFLFRGQLWHVFGETLTILDVYTTIWTLATVVVATMLTC